MADREIGIVVRAKDEATKQMGDIANSMKGNFQTVSTASALAGGAITAFLGSTLSGAAEAESANAALAHAVLGVSHATQEQLESTQALASELERKGVLDGDAITVGLAQLSTFGLSNEAVQALGGSMADLAVNQFGVNASSDQLAQTANTVAKALNGQFGVLEKSGIRFTEAQQHAIEFGTEMEKVAAINEGLAQNLKMTNEVALTTFEGKMAALNVQMGNVTESIGTALFPILIQLAENIKPIIDSILQWMNANPELFVQITQIVGIVGVVLTVLGALGLVIPPITAAVAALGAVFAIVTSPIGLIVIAIAALTAAIIYLWNTNEQFRTTVMEVWTAIVAFMTPIIENIKKTIMEFVDTISKAWTEDWGGVRTTFEEVWKFLSVDGLNFVKALFKGIQDGLGVVTKFVQENWTTIQGIFDVAMAAVKLAWGLFWNNLKLMFTIAWELIKGAVTVAMALFRGDWQAAWDGIKGIFTGIWNAMKTYVTEALGLIQGFLTTAWDTIKGAVTGFGDDIKKIWDGIWDGIKKKVDDVVNSIKGIIDGMVRSVNDAIGKVQSFGSSAVSFVTGGGKKALGGMVSSGSVYTVGENGPETFIPHQAGSILPASKTGGGGGNTVININGGSWLGTPEEIGDAIFNTFRLQNRI